MNETIENTGSDELSNPMHEKEHLELGKFRSYLNNQVTGITRRFNGKLESSDLVQQTLVEAYEKLDQFRGTTEGELAKWLSQILSSNTVDAVRGIHRKKRDINRERPIAQPNHSSSGTPGEWLPADQTSPSFAAQHAEQLLELSQAIGRLPTAQQEVIVLHHLQGLSLNEVATRINRSRSAVAGLAYRALKSLREYMAKHD